jgi:hypothetical protein
MARGHSGGADPLGTGVASLDRHLALRRRQRHGQLHHAVAVRSFDVVGLYARGQRKRALEAAVAQLDHFCSAIHHHLFFQRMWNSFHRIR